MSKPRRDCYRRLYAEVHDEDRDEIMEVVHRLRRIRRANEINASLSASERTIVDAITKGYGGIEHPMKTSEDETERK